MPTTDPHISKILVAMDFSPHSDAALRQAVWLAKLTGAKITLAHSLPDLRRLMVTASLQARMDLLYGEGNKFHQEIREKTNNKLKRKILELDAGNVSIDYETLVGEPYVELTHAVQAEAIDLVMTGSRGLANWESFFVGSTAKRLIRKCPASVWTVKAEHAEPPQTILAATDFSAVSRKAVLHGLWLSKLTGAQFHLLHAIDPGDLPQDLVLPLPEVEALRKEIEDTARLRLKEFVDSLPLASDQVRQHIWVGTPWREIKELATRISADLITLGTVGRSGIKGLLLGNTAEKVLDTCDCSILTVKPDDFVSPIMPPLGPSYP